MSVPLDTPLSKNKEINQLAAFQRFLPHRSNVPETAGREQSRPTKLLAAQSAAKQSVAIWAPPQSRGTWVAVAV